MASLAASAKLLFLFQVWWPNKGEIKHFEILKWRSVVPVF